VLAPLHVAPLARLGRARNTEDPRAVLGGTWPGLSDLAGSLGLTVADALRMPSIRVV
jgi:protease-4